MRKAARYPRAHLVGYAFIAPAALVIGFLILYPMAKSFVMSVTDWYMLSGRPDHPFVGLKNFSDVFRLSGFKGMSIATIVYTTAGVLGKMYLGLGVALILNRQFFGRTLVRGIVVVPWAIPSVVVATVFLIALDPVFGIVNSTLVSLHVVSKGIEFLSRPNLALATVIGVAIWRYFPFITLMLLAALQSVPKELYEVSSIDGAGSWSRFVNITWPLISPVWSIVLILQIVWTVREFDLVYLITEGGPGSATMIIGVDIYLNAFRYLRMGTAAAESVILTLLSLVFAWFYFRAVRRSAA